MASLCSPAWPTTSSQKLIPTPGFLPPGYLLFSCVFLCFLPPGEILKSGVGISFWIPRLVVSLVCRLAVPLTPVPAHCPEGVAAAPPAWLAMPTQLPSLPTAQPADLPAPSLPCGRIFCRVGSNSRPLCSSPEFQGVVACGRPSGFRRQGTPLWRRARPIRVVRIQRWNPRSIFFLDLSLSGGNSPLKIRIRLGRTTELPDSYLPD